MATLHVSADLDESFYGAWRDCLLSAGATDAEIDNAAAFLVTIIVKGTDQTELRQEQFELVAHHLASTEMTVAIGKGDSYVSVEFPSRPKAH